ncbi:hypothetical protein [Phnomibacter sp. MR]|uniref:hypothetical protein n=1 Tax=Phnomibacter sp. MR TaxID=3042318 RepID=UPI003A8018EF
MVEIIISVVGTVIAAAVVGLVRQLSKLNESMVRLDERVKLMTVNQAKIDTESQANSRQLTNINERLIRVEEYIKTHSK